MSRDTGDQQSKSVSRRTWLKGAAAGGASLLAGCGGGGGEETTAGGGAETTTRGQPAPVTSPTETEAMSGGETTVTPEQAMDEDGYVNQYMDLGEQTPILDVQLNRFAPGYDGEFLEPVEPKLADYSATWVTWIPLSLEQSKESWPDQQLGRPGTFDRQNDEYRVEILNGMLWSDGDEVTAEDWVLQAKLDRLIVPEESRQEAPPVVDWSVGDNKYELVFELNAEDGYNRPAVTNYAFFDLGWSLSVNMKRGSFYDNQLQALQDATTKSEKQSIRQKLSDRSLTMENPDQINTPGPYNPVEANKNVGTFETQKDHAVAQLNDFNWQGYKIRFYQYANPSKRAAQFSANKHDVMWAVFPPDLDVPDNTTQIVNWETGGMELQYNFGINVNGNQAQNDPLMDAFKKRKVRQAIAAITPPREVANAAKPIAQGPVLGAPSGILQGQVEAAFPDLAPNLDKYGSPNTQTDRAETLMQDAGLERNSSGTWVNSAGEPLTVTIMPSAQASEWQGAATGMAQIMKGFGIKSSVEVKTDPQVSAAYENGTYQTAVGGWGYGRPALFLAYYFFDPQRVAGQERQIKHQFMAPKRVGQPDSPVTTYDTPSTIQGVANLPLSQTRERVRKLVWVYNQALPGLPLTRDGSGLALNTETFNWADSPRGGIIPPARDDYPIYHVVPGKPREGWDQYPAIHGLECQCYSTFQGFWDGPWRGGMKANEVPEGADWV